MSSASDKIIEQVRQLPPDEQRHIVEQLKTIVPPLSNEDELEDEFERELAAEGFIDAAKPLTVDKEATQKFRDYKPITVEGQPLSEMIIEERR